MVNPRFSFALARPVRRSDDGAVNISTKFKPSKLGNKDSAVPFRRKQFGSRCGGRWRPARSRRPLDSCNLGQSSVFVHYPACLSCVNKATEGWAVRAMQKQDILFDSPHLHGEMCRRRMWQLS